VTKKIKSLRLITLTPPGWAAKTDIVRYAERQAQSCEYLLQLFSRITLPQPKKLFGYLGKIHLRQYQDLAAITSIPEDANRKSFYFDWLYDHFNLSTDKLERISTDMLQAMLAIQQVSYLRGHDRYRVLKDYEGQVNIPFKKVWERFFRDAITNAQKVQECLSENYSELSNKITLLKVIAKEDELINIIWRHNHVKTT
jgi:hypothetical protein